MTSEMHEIQLEILKKIRFLAAGGKYSELKISGVENDLFNYHLQKLVEEKWLEKVAGKYVISEKGKRFLTNVDEIYAAYGTFKVSVYMCVVQNGKILLVKRQKHPQFGYIGVPSEKIKFGEELLTAAKRGLDEEAGMTGDFKLIGVLRQIRKTEVGEMREDGIFFVVLCQNPRGVLKPGGEGKYFWQDLSEVTKLEMLFRPSAPLIIQHLIDKDDPKGLFFHELLPEPEKY